MAVGEFRRGQGPDALPQGEATRLNESTPRAGAFQDLEVPVMFAPDRDDDDIEPEGALGENMQVLLSEPDEGYRAPIIPKDRPDRMPRYIVRHLPELSTAVKNPAAPPALRALYRAIVRQLESEMRGG